MELKDQYKNDVVSTKSTTYKALENEINKYVKTKVSDKITVFDWIQTRQFKLATKESVKHCNIFCTLCKQIIQWISN